MNIGIIGSGAMGSGIAQVLATSDNNVFIFDSNPVALKRSKDNLSITLEKLVSKQKLTNIEKEQIASRILYIDKLDDLSQTDLVIEAIIEDLNIKQDAFKKLESIVSKTCILATNTSSLSIASIASICTNPERVIGIHFFNPAPIMALVEIIPAVQTDELLVPTIKDWVMSWGKVPVIVKDTPGFIVNRVARPFYSEALRIFEEGKANCTTIDAAMTNIGFKMGPFTLMDFIGHDVNYRVTESVYHALYFDPRFKPSLSQKRLFEAGYLGRKTGRGFYNYTENAQTEIINNDPNLLNEIAMRVLAMLINEAADAVFLNIASIEDVDNAMIKGVNYPKGLIAWGNEIGWENILETIDNLYHYYHEDRYRVSPWIRNKVALNF